MALSECKGTDNNPTEKDLIVNSGQVSSEQCGLCESDYLTPKSLKCLHSFCQKCLTEKVNAGDHKITCPTCDEETELPSKGVQGLTTNFMLIEKLERNLFEKQLKEKDSCIPCTFCENESENNEAIAWCKQCQDYMCKVAVKYHKEIRITKNHEIISLEMLQAEGIPRRAGEKDRMCPKHQDEKLKFYCETCEVPFCRDCEIIDHPRRENHVQTYLEDAIRKRSSDIQQEAAKCKNIGQQIDETIAQDERVEAAHQKAVEQTLKAYDDATRHTQDIFSDNQKQHREKFVADLSQFDEKRKHNIDDHKEKLKNIHSRLTSALATAQMLGEIGTQYDVADMYKDVITALRDLREFKPEGERVSEVSFKLNDKCLPTVKSIPAPGTLKVGTLDWVETRKFGNGNLSGARGLSFTPKGDILVADYTARAAKLFDGLGNLSKTITQGTASFTYPFDVYHSFDGYFYMTIKSANVKQITSQISYNTTRTIAGGSYSGFGIAAMKDGNWAVCCKENNTIYVYKSGGDRVKIVSVMGPNFIAITSENYFVFSSEKQKSVQVVAADGQLLRTIGPPPDMNKTAWSPQGVCCSKNDEVYVANQGEGAMVVYRFKVSGEFINCVSTDLSTPWGLAMSADDQQLAVVNENGTSVKVFSRK